jgi:hypothetical protein
MFHSFHVLRQVWLCHIDFQIMILARLKGGMRINHTPTTDNAAKINKTSTGSTMANSTAEAPSWLLPEL